jgi:serine protease
VLSRIILGACAALCVFCVLGAAQAAPPEAKKVQPNDPGYTRYSYIYDQVDAPAFWGATAGSTCSVKVAVLDSAVVATADVRAVESANFAPGSTNVAHGTEVASVIAATANNDVGVAGMSDCPILSARVLGSDGTGRLEYLAPAIDWAVSQGAKVINMSLWSLAGVPIDPEVQQAVQRATSQGVLVVVIAGNGVNDDCRGSSDSSANPIASGNPAAIRVAGLNKSGTGLEPCSNHGSALAEIAAPYALPVDLADGSFILGGGTSFSAPVVSAIAAEMFNLNPAMTPAQVKNCLMSSSTKIAGLDVASGGVVNAYNALVCAGYQPPPPEPKTVRVTTRHIGRGSLAVSSDKPLAALPVGTAIRLTAKPAKRWRFAKWGGLCRGTKPVCRLVAAKDGTAIAIFVRRK